MIPMLAKFVNQDGTAYDTGNQLEEPEHFDEIQAEEEEEVHA